LEKLTTHINNIAQKAAKFVAPITTCKNEGLNGLKCQIAPKHIVCNKQIKGKVALVVLFNNLGRLKTMQLLAESLNVTVPPKLALKLASADKKRETNRIYEQTIKKNCL